MRVLRTLEARHPAAGFALACVAASCGRAAPGARDAATDVAAAPIDTGPALAVVRVEDLGALPLPAGAAVSRDGTASARVGGRVVWTFGDTFVSRANPTDGSQVISATAGWSAPATPLALDQPVDDAGFPAQLIPYSAAEVAQNRADALDGWALWPAAVIDTGAADALVLFQRIKRSRGGGFDGVGLGTARLAVGATQAQRGADELFSRPLPDAGVDGGTPLYGSAGVSVLDAMAYFFACDAGDCRVARVAAAHADQRAAFEFYDGTAWVADVTRAAVVIRGVSGAVSVSFNPHLGRYLAINSVPLANAISLRTAAHIEGPWPGGDVTIAPSDGGVLAPADGSVDYLAQEHVELRSADATQIVITYARPTAPFRGDVRLARITLR